MITKPPATALRQALAPGEPISLVEAAILLGTSTETASAALTHLASRGDVTKVRKTLWVRTGATVDSYRLGARIVSTYAFSYGTALALHGAAATERSEVLISSPDVSIPSSTKGSGIASPVHGRRRAERRSPWVPSSSGSQTLREPWSSARASHRTPGGSRSCSGPHPPCRDSMLRRSSCGLITTLRQI